MRLYLAGPMTGFAHYNHAAFVLSKAELEEQGHSVITPFDANSRVWKRQYGIPFNPRVDKCDWGDPLLKHMFAEDVLVLLTEVDGTAMMSGWENSRGATTEHLIAEMFDLPILYEDFNWQEAP